MNDLKRKTIVGFVQLICLLGILLFLPAWTLDYWQAWLYLFVFGASTAVISVYLWNKDPQLLERRINAGPTAEKETSQKVIQAIAAIAFAGVMVVPALDRRFAWSHVPVPIVIAGDVLVALGFLIIFVVFRENTFTAAIIEVADDQKVISTGPYAIVRHPMYSGGLIMLFGTPLALGSWWGLLMFIALALAIVWRLRDEEKFLSINLPGYSEYRHQVRYRLVPLVF
ncbi:MAG: isoprenylcysteine carboxylmethyltransferase family protein [Candidatus Binatus sp.]|uniref:methyltransferase family protein n=1 Tax=Candidatus Binatus sp. TaxID=2811406 RepID=UPI002719E01E|nr:isoprenylcysteine carboxylmethyltransferase family protein [Candidatus Binatus sp.]MDO8432271.1 isoprenylcysteine carboxylmethyltransferase family protein [Candidatus Binatus sp.]